MESKKKIGTAVFQTIPGLYRLRTVLKRANAEKTNIVISKHRQRRGKAHAVSEYRVARRRKSASNAVATDIGDGHVDGAVAVLVNRITLQNLLLNAGNNLGGKIAKLVTVVA